VQPDISVVIPAHNEKSRVAPTIQNIARARTSGARIQFVVVDDASTDGTVANLVSALPRLLNEPNIDIRVEYLEERSGNYLARNRGAEVASADILFMTDGHVEFSHGWDDVVLRAIRPRRMLAGATLQHETGFRSYGCKLAVPRMGTVWNSGNGNGHDSQKVQIAACHAAVLTRELFNELGGYDTGMILYGGGEPEFSLRTWLQGAEIVSVPGLEVHHQFKTRDEFALFLNSIRHYWVHNCLRFAMLYRTELGCMQVIQHYGKSFPEETQQALQLVEGSDVWEPRNWLEGRRRRSFDWFVGYFAVEDETGAQIL
jgi:glycosyltransferase involved in cell wall biosynthesis